LSKHPKSIVNLIPEKIFQEVHQLSFGDIYFLENTIVTELNFGWEYGSEIIPLAEKHFGRQFFINYFSNRIYDYSLIAQDWRKFFDQNRKLKNSASLLHLAIQEWLILRLSVFSTKMGK